MSATTEDLPVYLYGRRIATLSRAGEGIHLEWDDSYPARRNNSVLSAALPFGTPVGDDAVANFFGGYLPEGVWLNRLAEDVGVGYRDVFALLQHVGCDLAGGLVVGQPRVAGDPRHVTQDELPHLLERAAGYLLGGGGSALPGFQRKLALTLRHDMWWEGMGLWPSTHIFKPAPERWPLLPQIEAWALDIARHVGLTDFSSQVEKIGGSDVLVVERYDRETVDGATVRIHQEDTAQALGLHWLGDAKFEQQLSGPTLRAISRLFDRRRSAFAAGEADRVRLLRYTTLNVALGNTDAHAKNHSILRPESGSEYLAPMYDIVPLALMPNGKQDLALRVGGEWFSGQVSSERLVAEAVSWEVRASDAESAIKDTLERIQLALDVVKLAGPEIERLRDAAVPRVEALLRGDVPDSTLGGTRLPPLPGFGNPHP